MLITQEVMPLQALKYFLITENIEIHSTFHANDSSPIATVTAAGSLANNVVGDGYAVTVGEGIVYAKGHFLKVSTDTVVASKYNKFPDNVAVGFNVKETVITSDADNTLLDNAAGFNNENAPGADRLKLDPFLVAIPFDDARANTDFLSLVDFQSGLPITKRFDTQFNSVDEFIAKRTKEEQTKYNNGQKGRDKKLAREKQQAALQKAGVMKPGAPMTKDLERKGIELLKKERDGDSDDDSSANTASTTTSEPEDQRPRDKEGNLKDKKDAQDEFEKSGFKRAPDGWTKDPDNEKEVITKAEAERKQIKQR